MTPAIAVLLLAQVLKLSGPAQGAPGATYTAIVTLEGTAGNVAAFQDTFSAAVTVSSNVPNKAGTCATAPASTRCVVSGFNALTIPDGEIVQAVTFKLMSSPGTMALTVTGTLGADPSGEAVQLAGSSLSIKVVRRHWWRRHQ